MLGYYSRRLEGTYIPNLRSSLKDCKTTLFQQGDDDQFDTSRQDLRDLHQLAFTNNASQTLMDRQNTLEAMGGYLFLGRLRVAFQTFEDIARMLPSFNKVSITPVSHATGIQDPLKSPLNLRQVFDLLGIPLDSSTVYDVIGHGWSVAKAQERFTGLQKQKLNVHAEIQMILYFSEDG
ncbi:hypothetical protein AJ80_05814 [Polytolypa hystricis UAMH7299]|uniref:Uncharacterized protein n=1 Tax=Polytolypa hystricis (strain UAMH7299) TaxID=1447883 RepID=A0A2B7Y0G1_POLH7|nr:hypothetical protein AJ80_05814 [Polytolypa hystricis UAMH7299]